MNSRARPYHHGNLRQSLVDAGYELARAQGPQAVVLRAVTRAAGVSHNAAYRHFADHHELLTAVAERCMGELADLMRTRTAEVHETDPRMQAAMQLGAVGRAYIDFALTEPGLFRTAFATREHPPPPIEAESRDEAELGPFELLSARLDRLVEVGILPPERRPGAEYAAWASVHGISMLLVDGPLQAVPEAERERAISIALAVVARGL
jgi:AcrR family transcriptional regulator